MKIVSAAAMVLAATFLPAVGYSQATKAVAGPDLHAGGASPSLIPNHETTEVILPGLHLSGATLTVDGVCTLKSYEVVSDTQIRMKLQGNRPVDASDDGCFLHVHHAGKVASTYVAVDLTDAEQQQQSTAQEAVAKAKNDSYLAGLGNQWVLHFPDGTTETLTAQPADPGALPDFTSPAGGTFKVMISDGDKVVIVGGGCMLSGTLSGNQVKDGRGAGSCPHGTAWTGQKK